MLDYGQTIIVDGKFRRYRTYGNLIYKLKTMMNHIVIKNKKNRYLRKSTNR